MTDASAYRITNAERLLEGPLSATLALPSAATNGQVAVVKHSLAPRALGAPVHTHRNEDEYSLVVTGAIGVEIGDEAFAAAAGSVVVKPRGIPHAFWNPTAETATFVELIVPGGFEGYFAELQEVFAQSRPPDLAALAAVAARYELEVELDSIPRLVADHGLD
jgi:quercetin dioxygenase-like cupin family protein